MSRVTTQTSRKEADEQRRQVDQERKMYTQTKIMEKYSISQNNTENKRVWTKQTIN